MYLVAVFHVLGFDVTPGPLGTLDFFFKWPGWGPLSTMERSHFRRWTADSVARFGDPRRSQYVAAFVCLCFFVDRFRCVFLFTRNLLRGRESGMDGVFSVLTFLDGANGGDLVAVFRAPSAYGNTVKRY